MSSERKYGPGVMRYVEESRKLLAQRQALIERVKKYRFDTIAVHGLYSVEQALSQNQGAIIEPVYFATSQGYRDSDDLEAALAYLIPTWCYSRIANPTTYYLQDTLALLEGYRTGHDTSCVVTSSGMSAISLATDAFVVKQKTGPEKINFVSSVQLYGGTFQNFNVRKQQEREIEFRRVFLGDTVHHRRHLRDAGPDAADRLRRRRRHSLPDKVDDGRRAGHRRGDHQPEADRDQGQE
jgi:hypothetical protein